MINNFPQSVKATLWSYDTDALNIEADKKRIITNVLNYGTKPAIDWLFATYDTDDIKEVARHPLAGEWNKKSLNFWSVIFDIQPRIKNRFETPQ